MNRKRWIVAPLTAAAVLLGLAFGVAPAAASIANVQACNYDYVSYNTCLNMLPGVTPYHTDVTVGIDLWMPESVAERVRGRGSYFRARLVTDVGGHHLISLLGPVHGYPKAGPTGLRGEFGEYDVSNSFLNGILRGDQAYYAEIDFIEIHSDYHATITTYKTGIIHGKLPECRLICPA